MKSTLRAGLILSIAFAGVSGIRRIAGRHRRVTSATTAKLELLQYLQEGQEFRWRLAKRS